MAWDKMANISQTTFWNVFSLMDFFFMKLVSKDFIGDTKALVEIMAWLHWLNKTGVLPVIIRHWPCCVTTGFADRMCMALSKSNAKNAFVPLRVLIRAYIFPLTPMLWCQEQVSQAMVSNCIPKNTVGSNYLSLPDMPASDVKFLICTRFSWIMQCRVILRQRLTGIIVSTLWSVTKILDARQITTLSQFS